MFPCKSVKEHANCSYRYSIFRREFVLVLFSFCIFFPYLSHRQFRELCLRNLRTMSNFLWVFSEIVIISTSCFVSSLGAHVMTVGLVVPEEKMPRSHAQPVVAMVEDKWEFQSDFSHLGKVTESMGFNLSSPKVECSVPPPPHSSSPHPALSNLGLVAWRSSIFVYLFPKSFRFLLRQLDCLGVADTFNSVRCAHASSWVQCSSDPCPMPVGRGCAPILPNLHLNARRINLWS